MRSRLGFGRESIGNTTWETRGCWEKIGVKRIQEKLPSCLGSLIGSRNGILERVVLQIHGWVHGADFPQCGIPDGGSGGGGGGG